LRNNFSTSLAKNLSQVGSNLVLANQNIKYFPRGAWKIIVNLGNFDAEPRSGEAEINDKFSKLPDWLPRWDDFRTLKWLDSIKCPELVVKQVKELLTTVPA